MSKDDREDVRRAEGNGHRPFRGHDDGTVPGEQPYLGGLLDGLPESGRGTEVRQPRAQDTSANPFRRRTDSPPPGDPTPGQDPSPVEPGPPSAHDAPAEDVPEAPGTAPDAASAGTDHRGADPRSATAGAEQDMHAHHAAAPRAEPRSADRGAPVPPGAGSEAASAASPLGGGIRPDHSYGEAERAAVYRAMRESRDVLTGFRSEEVPHDVLTRVLEAAHQAPRAGRSQPWDFLVVNDPRVRARVGDLVGGGLQDRVRAPSGGGPLDPAFEVRAILEAPLNIVVTVDPTRGGWSTPGRHAGPAAASHSAALAVENLWLAARAEGLGVGRITSVDGRDLADALELPSHLDVVAYLCVGHVEEFPADPEPGLSARARERPLSWTVHHDRYGRRGLPGQEPTSLLEETITAIGALDTRAVEQARARQDRMTKPPGSLGVLEEVSARLAGLAGECPPPMPEPAAVAVFAGDHGVHAQGVTAWPQEVTAQMVRNFLSGGAVVNAFAAQVGAEVTVVDVGVAGDLPPAPGLVGRKVARGTADFTQGPALGREQALQALEGGIEVARDLVAAGNRCLVTGDMGIANTTPAAALVCAFTGADPAHATGRGTGVDDDMYAHKVDVVRRALAANPVDPDDPIGTLAALGGLEHAALVGFVLGGAALRVPVLLDGVTAGAAALVAAAISPESVGACFAGHRSSEPGHGLVLEHLGLRPLVDLEMRLGEGTGALLALPLLQGAARVLRDVATFDDAGVSTAR
ncbi:nicotinate-nucleotide--dimethylbenzimidazole phosphoribosyltransferase [Nocardiopsis sp. ATB16-24]|uniref:nicotinate-nucleotide--dimethylbenzimidazole phosphoribosyltransferase n=1 Tax=Nocardiopsis sp. ATB16-24 TaxID=3019555 RepID=UPI00255503D5|nr:nicotinate-nucleotide--dimethylbenzimidazole phosphoribosyltransferase [Nocardiopsis sp. ATB16-24]